MAEFSLLVWVHKNSKSIKRVDHLTDVFTLNTEDLLLLVDAIYISHVLNEYHKFNDNFSILKLENSHNQL